MENVKKNYSEKIEKTLAVLKEDLNTVRAGRANLRFSTRSAPNITVFRLR